MVRWEPGTAQRLAQAALELFTTRGFDQVTAAEIAASVGLTERTFFRHFADKREVLFFGQVEFVRAFVAGAESAPAGATPVELIAAALRSVATFFPPDRRAFSRLRQTVIDTNPALAERELLKLAALATSLAEALRRQGVDPLAATLAAQTGTTVFGVAFAQWIAEGEERDLAEISASVLTELASLITAG